MASIVQTSKCEGDELVLLLTHCLPPDLAKLWHRTDDMLDMLRAGGITSYTNSKRIGNLLRTQKRVILKPNNTNKKSWFCFNEDGKEYDVPVQQRDALREKGRPQIETNYFTKLGITFKFMKTSTSQTTTNATAATAVSSTTPPTVAAAAAAAANTTPPVATATNTKTATANMNNNNNNNKTTPINKSSRPTISSEETGLFFARLDIIDDLVKAAEDHKTICNGSLRKIQKKCGFEVLIELHCDLCHKSYHVRSGPEPAKESPMETPRRGPKTNQLNMMTASAAHKAAIPVAHMLELCHEVGCVSPSEKGLFKMMDQRKGAVRKVAEEVLLENRKEHVAMVKEKFGNKQTIQHKDKDGKIHNICHGAVCADGAGDKRAYNHIITGSQHSTVVFSMLTGRVIAVRHDQVSCGLCDRRMTTLLQENKRADEITTEDLKHNGTCARNSKYSPAVAEEYALERIAEYLLIDPETGKLRPDDEAILVDCFVSDGDTKGATRFIATQARLVKEFDGKAIYLPDIGHFIKCISNALHSLASKHSDLRGVALLEPARIKSITSDVTKILKAYGKEFKQLKAKYDNDDDMKPELDVRRASALKRINAIVPHHCMDHSGCSVEDCFVIKRRREHINSHRVIDKDSELTDEQIIELHTDAIAKLHAENGRFRGKHMSMGKEGQQVVMHEITKRLDFNSIDRVATLSSSNRCENYFGVVAKYTHGKRLYYGRSDTFECIQLYVAATINNKNAAGIEDRMRKLNGISYQSSVRDTAIAKDTEIKEYHKKNKKSVEVIERRKASKIATTKKTVKNSTNSARHKTDKQSPTDDCKSNNVPKKKKPATTKKRKKQCVNCKTFHDGPCQEPCYDNEAAKKKKQKKKNGGRSIEELVAMANMYAS
eukprot:scaffold10289_cov75-Skeletonema_marinoi.AAC.1